MYSMFLFVVFFFNDTATTEIYTLSLHDALPICAPLAARERLPRDLRTQYHRHRRQDHPSRGRERRDRKSTRLNSSHSQISYAVFCLKKKKKNITHKNTENKTSNKVYITQNNIIT